MTGGLPGPKEDYEYMPRGNENGYLVQSLEMKKEKGRKVYTGFYAMVHLAEAIPPEGQSPGSRGVLTKVIMWVDCLK